MTKVNGEEFGSPLRINRNAAPTAMDLWNTTLRSHVQKQLNKVVTGKHTIAPVPTILTMHDRAILAAADVMTTRVRMIIDNLILLGEATTRRIKEIKDEHAATWPLLFWKVNRLKHQHADQLILQEAYKRALLLVANTAPPAEAEPDQSTDQVKSCGQCGGTGLAGATFEEQEVCGHCHGSGIEPPPAMQKGGPADE